MKTLFRFIGVTMIGLLAGNLLTGCSCGHGGKSSEKVFLPGPVISGGVMYYPAKPGATYNNVPVDYTIKPPTGDAMPFITVFSTNGLVIHLIDGDPTIRTNDKAVHFTNANLDQYGHVIQGHASPVSSLY